MSVVVRMEMPQNCCECPLRQEDYDTGEEFCPFTGVECLSIGRQDNCPIVCALPENHGRLVDADKEIDFHVNDFERVKTEGANVYSKAYSLSDLCDGITYAYDHADIIVPAEAERSET